MNIILFSALVALGIFYMGYVIVKVMKALVAEDIPQLLLNRERPLWWSITLTSLTFVMTVGVIVGVAIIMPFYNIAYLFKGGEKS